MGRRACWQRPGRWAPGSARAGLQGHLRARAFAWLLLILTLPPRGGAAEEPRLQEASGRSHPRGLWVRRVASALPCPTALSLLVALKGLNIVFRETAWRSLTGQSLGLAPTQRRPFPHNHLTAQKFSLTAEGSTSLRGGELTNSSREEAGLRRRPAPPSPLPAGD